MPTRQRFNQEFPEVCVCWGGGGADRCFHPQDRTAAFLGKRIQSLPPGTAPKRVTGAHLIPPRASQQTWCLLTNEAENGRISPTPRAPTRGRCHVGAAARTCGTRTSSTAGSSPEPGSSRNRKRWAPAMRPRSHGRKSRDAGSEGGAQGARGRRPRRAGPEGGRKEAGGKRRAAGSVT